MRPEAGGSELAVPLSKNATGNARISGLIVKWHNTTGSGQPTIPAHIVLCQGADQDATECKAL